MRINGASINDVWRQLISALLSSRHECRPRGRLTREYVGVQLLFDAQLSLLDVPGRDLNYRFAAAEALWMILGRSDVASLARVNSRMREFSDDGATLAGAYGPRFREQLPYVLGCLARDRDTRQAVVEIWRPAPAASRDVPCTLSWQFLLRDDVLHLIATMRSSDAWLGVPYDAFSFACILQLVAGLAGVGPGRVVMHLGSSHLYEEHFEAAAGVTAPDIRVPPHVWLSPLTLDDFAYLETVADRALDKGVLVHGRLLPSGWDRLLGAVCARNSAEALGVLRGEA